MVQVHACAGATSNKALEYLGFIELLSQIMSLPQQLEQLQTVVWQRYGLRVKLFLCADLHMLRALLNRPATGSNPFRMASEGEQLVSRYGFECV